MDKFIIIDKLIKYTFKSYKVIIIIIIINIKTRITYTYVRTGSRLLFKFRSGTHGLNEELGRHRGREGKTECSLCGDECENVSHVLWECSA